MNVFVGELAQWAMAHIRPLLNELIPFMISCIHEEQYLVVINNSVWALGEMAVQVQNVCVCLCVLVVLTMN
jgi:hypothetical protein